MGRTAELQRASFHVAELDCAEEAAALRRALEGQAGISDLAFDFLRARMDVSFQPHLVTPDGILRLAGTTGFHLRPWDEGPPPAARPLRRPILTVLSGLSIVVGMGWHYAHTRELWTALGAHAEHVRLPLAVLISYGLAIAAGLAMIAPRLWAALRSLRADMHVLVAIAVSGAIGLGQWLEAATVSFLFALALQLDQWSLHRARRAIAALVQLAPTTARRRDAQGGWSEQPVELIQPGDHVLVPAAERIPLDGQVAAGESAVDQAPITGESQPVAKRPGDEVFAGTINGGGPLEILVTRRVEQTTLARILRMVEEAQSRRAPSERFVEVFARYYTPTMIGLAIVAAVVPPLFHWMTWSGAFYNALVLLVIACPCALVISTPVTIVSALASAARRGVLIKGGRHLEMCAHLRAVAFDKTGTLTTGQPAVERVVSLDGSSETELLAIAVALESPSNHPLARALRALAHQRGITPRKVEQFQQLSGLGVAGELDGQTYWLGGERLLAERTRGDQAALRQAAAAAADGHSVIAIGTGEQLKGLLIAADEIRPAARHVVAELKQLGVRHVAMLTGDHEAAAARVARATGVDAYRAGTLPEEKLEEVSRLRAQYHHIAMVGDGVNDSPALAAANVGIAMGAIGTAAALETSDITLMADELQRLPWLIAHARRALRVVQANIVLALGIKVAFLLLASLGWATLWSAIAADMGASLLVIVNGLRLCDGRELTSPSKSPPN